LRCAGEGVAWSTLIQQLISTSHQILDGVFLGLEDPTAVASARYLLHNHFHVFKSYTQKIFHSADKGHIHIEG
jgi:hypothetical protein